MRWMPSSRAVAEVRLLGLARQQRVEALVRGADQVVAGCAGRDGEALDPVRPVREDERLPVDGVRHPRRQLADREPVEGAGEAEVAERAVGPSPRSAPPAARRCRASCARRARGGRRERRVRAEQRLEPAPLAPVDDERLVAPEEPVVDEHHVGSQIGRAARTAPSSSRRRTRAASRRRRRPPAARAARTRASAPPRAARSRRRRSRPARPRAQLGSTARSAVVERVPCGRSGCGAAW